MMQRQEEQSGDRRRMWLGRRASVLLAACASVLTLGMFAAVAVTVFNDNGGQTAPDASGLRIAQGHEETGRNPLRSAEDAETDAPNTRIALAHTTAMQSPWQKIANDITSVIAPAYGRDAATGCLASQRRSSWISNPCCSRTTAR